MIKEYLTLQERILQRAQQVGKFLQASKHYACVAVPFPAAVPFIGRMWPDGVDIVIGVERSGDTSVVRLPFDLFDNGTAASVRDWTMQQNDAHEIARLRVQMGNEDAIRANEVAMLRELQEKYPNE